MAGRRALVPLLLALGCGSSTITNGSGPDARTIDAPISTPTGDGGVPDAPGTTVQCPPYQSMCQGACIDTVTDPQNCGGCGKTCTGNLACSGGACSATCLP